MLKPKLPKAELEKSSLIIRIVFTAVAILGFSVYFLIDPNSFLSQRTSADGFFVLAVCLVLLFFSSLFFLFKSRIKSDVVFISLLAVAAAALALRLYMFDHISNDYNNYLSRWLYEMRLLPGVEPITTPIGDYNMPYLYFLFGVSRSSIYDLYLIKLLSVAFDFVLAFGAVKLVSVFKKGDLISLAAFTAALFAPTMFLNSAYWGQCDGIYAALSILALYFALSNKPKSSIVFFALAFSFKIQVIFILPIIIFLIIKNKISLKHLVLFPVTFFLTLVPSLLCGRNFYDTFSIYISQTESYPELTLNCPSIWALFPSSDFDSFGTAALFLAGAVCLIFGVYVYNKRENLSNTLLFDVAFLFVLIMPFLLPRMHERYFYLAEILSIIYVFVHKERVFVAPIIQLSGFSIYGAYLFGYRIFELQFLAVVLAAVIIYLCKKFVQDISVKERCLK